jgi:hypothetical protein
MYSSRRPASSNINTLRQTEYWQAAQRDSFDSSAFRRDREDGYRAPQDRMMTPDYGYEGDNNMEDKEGEDFAGWRYKHGMGEFSESDYHNWS